MWLVQGLQGVTHTGVARLVRSRNYRDWGWRQGRATFEVLRVVLPLGSWLS